MHAAVCSISTSILWPQVQAERPADDLSDARGDGDEFGLQAVSDSSRRRGFTATSFSLTFSELLGVAFAAYRPMSISMLRGETSGGCHRTTVLVTVSGYQLGIDFGTSTTVAAMRGPERTGLLLFDASPLLSSAVFAEAGLELLTGADAERAALAHPAGLEPNPKRRIDEGTVWLGYPT